LAALLLALHPPLRPTPFPYTTLFRSACSCARKDGARARLLDVKRLWRARDAAHTGARGRRVRGGRGRAPPRPATRARRRLTRARSEEHTSELQSRENLVCRLPLEKKK